eukprot:g35280.t1
MKEERPSRFHAAFATSVVWALALVCTIVDLFVCTRKLLKMKKFEWGFLASVGIAPGQETEAKSSETKTAAPCKDEASQKTESLSAESFSADAISLELDTIIIGSGMGGSTCANLLAQAGHKVLLLEQHSTLGGCTHTFGHKGCEWDTGLHYTSRAMADPSTRPGAILDYMSLGKQKWTPLSDPYDMVIFPERSDVEPAPGKPGYRQYPFYSGRESLVEMMASRVDPALAPRVKNWLSLCNDIHEGFTALFMQLAMPWPLSCLFDGPVRRLYDYGRVTVRQAMYLVLDQGYSKDEVLTEIRKAGPAGLKLEAEPTDPSVLRACGVLCHPIGDYAVQPRQATMAAHGVTLMHYVDGGSYSVGPTQNISRRLAAVLPDAGGKAMVDATVIRLLLSPDGKRVVGVRVVKTGTLREKRKHELPAGDSTNHLCEPEVGVVDIYAKQVVCATSVYNLYEELLRPYPSLAAVRRFHNVPAERSVQQSKGHIFLFCKLKGSAEELKLPKSNLWYFNQYKMDEAFDRYMANPTKTRPPTVYIGFPCTKDPTWSARFPDVSNCILISDGLHSWFEKWADMPVWRRGSDYERLKAKFAEILLEILYEVVPTVRGKVEFHHLGTPLTEEWFLHSYLGGSYGTLCSPEMFDASRKNAQWTMTPRTPLGNLYMAGSDAFLPSATGAMYGGLLGAISVLGPVRALCLIHQLVAHAAQHAKKKNPSLSRVAAFKQSIQAFIS